MNQLQTVESKVLEILKKDKDSRYSDMTLCLRYYAEYGGISLVRQPFHEVMLQYFAYDLPCFESIRRARQRVQSCFPEYGRNPQSSQYGGIRIVIEVS